MIKSSRMRLKGYAEHMRDRKIAHTVLVGNAERKRPLRRLSRRLEGNIKIHFRGI